MTQNPTALGIDIGGSGIKGGLVDIHRGDLISDRFKIPTPPSATPHDVLEIIKKIVEHFHWQGPIGITVPAVVINGITKTATNIDKSWIDLDAQTFFSASFGQSIPLINDADAAGIAEIAYGAAKNIEGSVLLLTVGTGIGSALIYNKQVMPNTELGQLIIREKTAEKRAASSTKEKNNLSYEQWAKAFNEVLEEYHKLFWPDLIIVGGGISRKADKWIKYLSLPIPVIPAHLDNNAGIIGAAYLAYQSQGELAAPSSEISTTTSPKKSATKSVTKN